MADLLSKHSSNPLQAPSDDPVNKRYLKDITPLLQREKARGDRDPSSVHNAADAEEEDVAMMGSDDEDDPLAERTFVPDDEESDLGEEEDEEEYSAEERTLYLKDPQEQRQILDEIADLEKSVPRLAEDYLLIDRLGEGIAR
ncbi:hypothetical protein FRB90_011476, partial [Tulasnella sp. 427]